MTEDRDPYLNSLFSAAQRDLDGEAFTGRVLHGARSIRYRLYAGLAGVGVVLLAGAQLLSPALQELALGMAWGLTRTLIDLGDGWLAWLASPVNTVGGLLVLGAKALRVLQKKIRGALRGP